MLKFKSKRKIERFDEYNRVLGDFTMRMIINELCITKDTITPSGFYYYINDEGETITVAPIKNSSFSRQQVTAIEAQLSSFTTNHIFDVIDKRAVEFTFLKWQIENGSSFGLLANEWETDLE
ncbi:hypothetical protein [Chryseobacterium sp. MP_3.2]|uniref:hypothetical protein n=1 Tax=Chryseobacterium sp. MP_3.2 TaxID=3071712 RepID=UPI002E0B5D32|nr:hypothetical protein [Chryseobacterium sp. MP_3.2]